MVKRDLTADEQESVLAWIASGKFLRVWCRNQAAVDPSSTADAIRQRVDVFKDRSPEFAAAYELARLKGAHEIAEDAVDLIDMEPGRTVTGGYDSAEVAWRKNQAYFRMEALKKWFPQKYGDKVAVDANSTVTNYVIQVPQLPQSTDQWTQQYGSHGLPIPAPNKP